ncbi:glycoside hydrolase family 6 protein [Marinitenerispora sediminis]|uniref:Glucanase n=1 Tax=Marinitenerispora sediminis TaxID=1931232 RepID=A0A368SXZ7_9ACTN|nr:glycoside hydrolase family 6 protein [Marinitenerispora sediminis]RCV48160.1 cellobiohydrolase [Marinitenerispora sediminis]RCV49867.1 cellobiohydrolase [Marinitenerispora sediminis]RCV51484.1 cellobiohydrolase [Marinitenerispora sediminis]
MRSTSRRSTGRSWLRRGLASAAALALGSSLVTAAGSPAAAEERVANPFAGADAYVNPEWAGDVRAQAAQTGGQLGQKMESVAQYPTAVWMDRIAAIEGPAGGMGLRDHLDAALEQQSGSTPMVVTVVVYNLPNRDCAALASNGELRIDQNGMQRYQQEYIDPIAEILGDPAYESLRIVAVIEPDSLPNLVTNVDGQFGTEDCREAAGPGGYVDGVRYALDNLQFENVYNYVDIGHSGWLGWPDTNFPQTVSLLTSTIRGTQAGVNSVSGFITNTANYTPTVEPFLTNPDLQVGGQPVRSAAFYEWNPRFAELGFAQALRTAFVNSGFPSDIGMLIDTSRNGWGGPDRPTSVSTSTNLNTYVDESRVDTRPHRGNWCNQAGAGIGERPRSAPAAGIDAYVWVKPPGESDGVSEGGIVDPDDPAKGFDRMCDPTWHNTWNPNVPTNALPNAPHAGRWFPEQFEMLVENAHPAL